MLLENNLKNNIIKLLIYIVLIIVFSIFFINKILLADKNTCVEKDCYETRIIKVLVLYDDEVFFEKDWKNNLKNRFIEINDFYFSNFKIKWQIIAKKQFNFNKNINNLSNLFTFHKAQILNLNFNMNTEVILSIIGREIKGNGIAGTFSNIVMVTNLDKLLNYKSSVIIAHEFGHLFGAWHTQRMNDFMLVSGANKLLTSKESSSILKLMRNYNFIPETIVNNDKVLNRISRLYDRHHARGEINPVARLLTDYGNNFYLNKQYNEALTILKKSIKYYGRWGKTRMILSKTYYELGNFNNAFTELTRAVFFGSQPDLEFENKLRNKFVDLQKLDPSINNPFIPN